MSGHDSRGGRKPLTHIEARTSHLVAHLGKSTESLLSPKKGDPDREVPPNEKMGRLPKALIAAGYAKAWQLVEADESALAEILYPTGEAIGEQGVAKIRSVLTAVRLSFRPLSEKLRTQLSKENPRRKAPKKKKGRTRPLAHSSTSSPPPPAPQEPAMTSPDPNTITLETLFPNKEGGIDRTTPMFRRALAKAGYVSAAELVEASTAALLQVEIGKGRTIGPVFVNRINAALAEHGLMRADTTKPPLKKRVPPTKKVEHHDEEDLPPEAGEDLPPRMPLCGGLCHLPSKEEIAAKHTLAQNTKNAALSAEHVIEMRITDLRTALEAAEEELTAARAAREAAETRESDLAYLLETRERTEACLKAFSGMTTAPTP